MKLSLTAILLIIATILKAQEPVLTTGSVFPQLVISPIRNAPVKEWDIHKDHNNKYYILNFWGTWCSPCIPEMDSLAKLQAANKNKLQVIAISDDAEDRLQKYLAKKPSGLWLATDTNYTLYSMLGLASVGQSIIVNPAKKIVGIVMTDSINQRMIDRLLRGDSIHSSGKIKEAAVNSKDDMFGVDSLMNNSFTVRGYMTGRQTMMKRWLYGGFNGRRVSWINLSLGNIYRESYNIHSTKQEIYDSSITKKEVYNFEDKSSHYSVDLLVRPEQKDSIFVILRKLLINNLPVKARLEERKMDVYVLKRKEGVPLTLPVSKAEKSTYSFSGKGYIGEKVTVADFANIYITNELELPVKDETGLTGFYDISTKVDLRTTENIKRSVEALGLVVVKEQRAMPVIVYYK